MSENREGIGSGADSNESMTGIDLPAIPIEDLKITLQKLGYDIAKLDEQMAGLLNHELAMLSSRYHPENIENDTEIAIKNAKIDALRLIFIYGYDTSLALRLLIDQLMDNHTHTAELSSADPVREEAAGIAAEYSQDRLVYNIRLILPAYIEKEMLKRYVLLPTDIDESRKHLSILSEIIRNCSDGYTVEQLDVDKIQIIKDYYKGELAEIEEIIKIYAVSIASMYASEYFNKTVLGRPTPETWQNVVDVPDHVADE